MRRRLARSQSRGESPGCRAATSNTVTCTRAVTTATGTRAAVATSRTGPGAPSQNEPATHSPRTLASPAAASGSEPLSRARNARRNAAATWVSPSSRHSRRAVCRAIPAAYEVMTGSEASSQQRFNTARYAGNSSQRRARVVGRGWVYGGCSGEGVRDRVGVGGRDGDGDGGVLGEGDGEGEREGEGMGVSVGPAARPRPAFTAPHRPAPPPSPGPPRACPAAGVRSGRPGCGRGRCGRRGGRVPRRGRGRW